MPHRYNTAAKSACHARTICQPVNQEMNFRYFGGDNSKAQWYWPAAVGIIDTSSPRDAMTAVYPIQTKRKPQNAPVRPPSMTATLNVLVPISTAPSHTDGYIHSREPCLPSHHDRARETNHRPQSETPLRYVSKARPTLQNTCLKFSLVAELAQVMIFRSLTNGLAWRHIERRPMNFRLHLVRFDWAFERI